MQSLSASLKAALIDIDARVTPRTLVDLYELYDSDAVPGVSGFDAADAIETFSGSEITWNGIAYRREVINRSDIIRSMGEKTNSVTITFSNISRYLATLAQSQTIEGMILVIRTVVPSVTDDSLVLFVGRAEKPSDIDKKEFSLTARQDFGNINQTLPPRKFTADDPEGRLPSDVLYEGINLIAVVGSLTFPRVELSPGLLGRLFGRRRTVYVTEQWSSTDSTPYGQVVPEIFGRCQMQGIPFAWADKGSHVGYLMAFSNGPISAITDLKSRTEGLGDPVCSFATPPAPAVIHLGDIGGTGTNNGNTCQADLAGGQVFSHLAYIEGASLSTDPEGAVATQEEVPTITGLVKGRKVPLPNSSGVYGTSAWSDNPVHIARFILTDPGFVNINEGFMEDAVNYQTGLHCDQPLIDDTESQTIVIHSVDVTQGGTLFTRYRSTGIITPRYFLYNSLGDVTIIPEFRDGPYVEHDPPDPVEDLTCPIGFHRDPESGLCVPDASGNPINATQPLLRKRYTANCPITAEVRAVDFLYKTIFPAFKGFMRVNKRGKYELRSEKPSDATRIRGALAVGATAINVYDVTPWKSGDLLTGRILLGLGLTTSEVRNVSSADYSTSGNSVTLAASVSGTITATASGANLSGGSTTVQASGTVTIGGTPAAGNQVTITIDGIAVAYILGSEDTTGTVAAMLAAYINATKRLSYYIQAIWDSASPTVITIKCLHGALNLDSALLKAHTGPIADPTTAPTVAAAASGTLQAGDYLVAYANQTAIGLTALTLFATVTLTANQKINVSALPAFPGTVTGRQFFVSDAPNSPRLRYLTTRADAADFSINSLPLPGAAVPPSHNTTSEELIRVAMSFATNSQDVYPAWQSVFTITLNDIYLPTTPNGHKYQATSVTTGITGATEPTWPTSAGGTVVDSGVTWTEIGSTVLQQAGLTRANISKDTFKWPLGSQQSSVNQVKGSYRDAKNDFALTPYRVNDPTHQAQVKKIYPLEFDGSAIDNYNQFFRIANWMLSKNREGDWFNALETGPQGLVLEEGDVICASDDSGGLINVATRIEEIRITKDHNVSIQRARKYSTNMFSDDVGTHSIPIASNLRFVETKDSIIEFIDSPPLRDADGLTPGFYVAVSHDLALEGDWRGWELYADYGDGYTVVASGDVPATLGECTTTLGTVSDPSVWDRTNSVTFTLDYEEASSPPFVTVTEQDILSNGRKNLFLIGNEYVQAATVVNNGNRSYTISTLLRARFGSDGSNLANLTHGSGERVVFINGAETLVQIDAVRLNAPFNYKVKTTNQDLADVTPESFTWTGGTVKPLAPVNLRGSRNAAGDLLIEWTRRERLPLGLRDFAGTPLSEESEIYVVEIYSGSTLLRTIRNPNADLIKIADWKELFDIFGVMTINADQSLSCSGGKATAVSIDQFNGNFQVEFTRTADSPPKYLGVESAFKFNEDIVGAPFYQVAGSDFRPMNNSSYAVSSADGDKFTIQRIGNMVQFFKNPHLSAVPVPLYETTFTSSEQLKLIVQFSSGTQSLDPTSLSLMKARAYRYTANQQVDDGFTPNVGTIKVRVAQESAIVGRGHYIERNL